MTNMKMQSDDDILNEVLSTAPEESSQDQRDRTAKQPSNTDNWDDGLGIAVGEGNNFEFRQWQVGSNDTFRPAGITRETIPSGVYVFDRDDNGLIAKRIKVITDSLVELPDNASERVLSGMQKFWNMEDRYRQHGLLYKRGILLWGPPGCHSRGTKVVMFDGSSKNVEDVIVGDYLMGPDGKSRQVLALCRGKDDMFRIHPVKGEPFDVNGHHILSLTRSRLRDTRYPPVLNTSVNEYRLLTNCSQRSFKLRRSKALEFNSIKNVEEPYMLGVWLGAGTESSPSITTADKEIVNLCYNYADKHNLTIRAEHKTDSKCYTYNFVGDSSKGGNHFINFLKNNSVFR